MPLNEQLKEIPRWHTPLIRCATQRGVVWTWFRKILSGICHNLLTVWSCGFQVEGILLDNVCTSVAIRYMTNNLEGKLCFGCHYSVKIVALFAVELADLFSVCAKIVNSWYMKILQLGKLHIYWELQVLEICDC
jgi:hypothetical protein